MIGRAIPVAFVVLLGCAGIVSAGASLYDAARILSFALRSDIVMARVERVDSVPGHPRGVTYVPWFRIVRDDGVPLARSHSGNGWLRYASTQTVRVRRDREDPTWVEADPVPVLLLGPLAGLSFGSLLLALTTLVVRSPGTRLPNRPSGTGTPIGKTMTLWLVGSLFACPASVLAIVVTGEVSETLARRALFDVVSGCGLVVLAAFGTAVLFHLAGGRQALRARRARCSI